ncbi:hypothetical protein M758_3G105700 [Ceratodon purpureus]|nr:hypothetical protein M758_3G105700 [Ceratodon purpureus]
MEGVKGTIPRRLLEQIEASTDADLATTCTALASHLATNVTCRELLHQVAHPLNTTCAKHVETALRCKEEGNAAFKASSYQEAIDHYTKAIRYNRFATDDDKKTLATLFVNRAAATQALGHLMAVTRDCTRAIGLQPEYSKAWYRRGRAWAGMQWYDTAIDDLGKALNFEASVNGKNDISRELDRVKKLMATGAERLDVNCGAGPEPWGLGEVICHDGVSPYWTPDKNWGIQATKKIDVGSLALEEEPIAALISKDHRNTRCHYCFDVLPPDPVACFECAIPIYCDEPCLRAACDESSEELDGQTWRGEHMHECTGATWSAVLPTDAVLAARLFFRGQENARLDRQLKELCHHYNKMSGAAKVEAHVLATVVAHCLMYPAKNYQQTMGDLAAKLVCLIAVVRANAMAIHIPADISTQDEHRIDENLLSLVEQVNVGQGVYYTGSKFNHACNANVHASFKGRHLRVQTIKPIQAGVPLELCYGAQVGEMRRDERQMWLQDRYFFTCECPSCKTVVQPDLLLFSFRCPKAGCNGVVPGPSSVQQPDQSGDIRDSSTEGNVPRPGCCIACGSELNMQYSPDATRAVMMDLERVELKLQPPSRNQEAALNEALNLLKLCQGIFHASSKEMAKAEDVVARAYCLVGQPHDARAHCKVAIQILEKIYGKDHIAVANERLKLASIALAAGAGDEVRSNLALANDVMRIHYGSDHPTSVHLDAFHQLG